MLYDRLIEQRAQELHQLTTNNAIFIYSKYLFSSIRWRAKENRTFSETNSPLWNNLLYLMMYHFRKRKFCCAKENSLKEKAKRAFSAIKKKFDVFFVKYRGFAVLKEKREGVYIKHLYFFLLLTRLVWYVFASFFLLPSDDMFTGTFVEIVVVAYSISLEVFVSREVFLSIDPCLLFSSFEIEEDLSDWARFKIWF